MCIRDRLDRDGVSGLRARDSVKRVSEKGAAMTARRRMRLMRRGGKLAVAVLGVLLLVLLTAVPAFAADRWTDITDMELSLIHI